MDEHGRSSRWADAPSAASGDAGAAWRAPRAAALATDSRLDELAATEARVRYRVEGLTPIAPDAVIARSLVPGERLLAVHHALLADSRAFPEASVPVDGVPGDLYLTSARLVFVGGVVVAFPLDDVEEADVAGEHLLLVLHDGVGLLLAVDRPRLLRVQLAAARAATRVGVSPPPAAELGPADPPSREGRAAQADLSGAARPSGQPFSR